MGKLRTSYVLVLIALSLHLFGYLDFYILNREGVLPGHWNIQFNLLIMASFFISLVLALLRKWIPGFLSIKFIVLILIGYPLGDSIIVETILLISIILESVYYLSLGAGIVASLIAIIVTFLNQKPVVSWGLNFEGADSHQLLFFLFITLLILFISSYLKKVTSRVKEMSHDISRLDFAVKELSDINLGFQNYALTIEKDSIESERKRISREMHDIIGYTLTNQLMIIQAVLSMNHPLPEKIKSLLLQSQTQTNEGMSQARSALHKLREFSPDRDSGIKLLYKMVKSFEQVTGIKIEINFGNTPGSFGEEIDKALYRLVQEGLTNAFRHGKATEISISLSISSGYLIINTWDNGIGADNIIEGIGLKGMRERIEALGGSLKIKSAKGSFSIKGRIPYKNGVNSETATS